MILSKSGIKESGWNDVKLPTFDIEKVAQNTDKNPKWIHFGAGNIFRGFIARVNQTLLEKGVEDTGIIAADSFGFDIIDEIYDAYDNLTMLVRLKADGSTEKEVIAGVSRAYKANPKFEDYQNIKNAFCNPSLQMISFTITEKGYNLKAPNGEYIAVVKEDMENGPEKVNHVMSIVTSLLFDRFKAGLYPLAVCSMDNCSHNGEKLSQSVLEIAKAWFDKEYVTQEFIDYLSNEDKISFPWSMIDKITPRPDESVAKDLSDMGIEKMNPIITKTNTFIAPFVNAEVAEYLVIEDKFPNGRPKLEEGGVYLTDRDTVNNVETMKVTTCLNPLHTALAVYGPVLGYDRIYKEMENPILKKLVEKIGYDEGMKVVVDPKIISPKSFIDEVVNERLANPFIPDDPARIATDTSQKVGIRFGETIKSYIKSDTLDVNDLTAIPLAIAGWFRYLLGVDDKGQTLQLSSDPLLEELTTNLKDIKLGSSYNGELLPMLSNESIFGLNLVDAGLSTKIEGMFKELIACEGAVEKTLQKYLA